MAAKLRRSLRRPALALLLLVLLVPGCRAGGRSEAALPTSSNTASSPVAAARAGFESWAAGRVAEARLIAASEVSRDGDSALVAISADIRESPDSEWTLVELNVPVARVEDRWQPPAPAAFEQVMDATRPADIASPLVSPTGETPAPESEPATATPVPGTVVPLPPPDEGEVLYAAGWTEGLDGWIGPSEWSAGGGYLVNSGARPMLDPWLEAPVRVDPWRDIVIEFEAEVPAQQFGSFGLVARAGPTGMFLVGLRGEEPAPEGVAASAFIDAEARGMSPRHERLSLSAARTALAPGWHLFRVEFRGTTVALLIDGGEVTRVSEQPFTPGEFLGLWSEATQLRVRNFRVIGL